MEYKGVDYSDPNRPYDRRFKQRVTPRKTHQVGKIWELHSEIARRLVLGQKGTVIAKALGCTPATVSNVRNSQVIQDRMAILRGKRDVETQNIAQDIKNFAPTALKVLMDIVEGRGIGANASPALRAKGAGDLLDRAGHGAVRREERITGHLTLEQIEEIKRRAAGSNSPVIDAEYRIEQ